MTEQTTNEDAQENDRKTMATTTCDSCGKAVRRRPGYDAFAWIMCAACKRDMGAGG
jgi:hypothetical protein